MIKENKRFYKAQERRIKSVGGDVLAYIYIKFEQIQEDTGLNFRSKEKKNKRWYEVYRKEKIVKKGSFKDCMDFIVNVWKKK